MRVVFAGTPEIAVPSLTAIAEHGGWEIPLVLSQPDRPAGRGRKLSPSPVRQAAEALGLTVATPEKPKELRERLTELAPDAIAVVAYGHIFRRWLLELPPHGCVNLHFSLLPRHRGVAPVQWSILEGDVESGVSVIRMDRGVDTGPVFRQSATPIGEQETSGELLQRLARIGAGELVRTLEQLEDGSARPAEQPDDGATYARRLEKEDGRIDWSRSAVEIHRQVRGLSPWPGAFTTWRGTRLKLHRVECRADRLPAGAVRRVDGVLLCGTGEGSVELKVVQPQGKPAMEGDAWALGARLTDPEILGATA
ncbi:MAG: methionyl-tRNA formyltransferase [Gemmatimonadota bacterium]|nr:MAG: methionyl-tRNA formyltransferase [Gemmatimonadota bacterium]